MFLYCFVSCSMCWRMLGCFKCCVLSVILCIDGNLKFIFGDMGVLMG